MDLNDYLMEVQIGKDDNLSKIFNVALQQVFSKEYLRKIDDILKKAIKLKYVDKKNQNIVAYSSGNGIFVNEKPFKGYSRKQQIQFLLHEFMHLLQRKRKFFFFKEFDKINLLTNKLYKIVKKNLTKPYEVFLTGKNMKIGPGGKHEILGYLMSDTIEWNAITEKGKKEFIKALKDSRLFNLNHSFWKKRLT